MTLDDLRLKIDSIDDTLLKLYNERMELVHQVGELKNTTGTPIYRPEREQAILNRLKKQNKGKLTPSAIDALFLEMFAVARNLELPEAVAFLGPEASFTHQAAESKFGYVCILAYLVDRGRVSCSRKRYSKVWGYPYREFLKRYCK